MKLKGIALACLLSIFTITALAPVRALADPGAGDVPALAHDVQSAVEIPADTFVGQVVRVWVDFHASGLPLGLKIALVTLLILALFKVSFLRPVWDKLGAFKAFAAPIVGLLLGLSLLSAGGPVTFPVVLAYLGAGGGAVLFHELLDAIKAIPGLGSGIVKTIDVISSILGGS